MGNAVQRNFRLEGRSASATTGANSFQFGVSDPTVPTVSVGDAYCAITKLAVGSYTSPGTNALSVTRNMSVTGTVSMPGYMFCAGYVGATGSKITSTGQVNYTVARTSGFATGVWTITFASAHPLGANYIINLTAQGGTSYISPSAGAPTSTYFRCAT